MRCWFVLLLLLLLTRDLTHAEQTDVLIYGATPAGIAAALAAAEEGEKVMLVERSDRIGGMLTNGLCHVVEGSPKAFCSFYRRFTSAVARHYREAGDKQAMELCREGTVAEPKVNFDVLSEMLKGQSAITICQGWALEAVAASSDSEGDQAESMRTLEVGLFADLLGERHSVSARFFIDATYEGDLLAAARLPYRVGREGREEYGEDLAPAEADSELQAYNPILCLTRDEVNQEAIRKPTSYDAASFADLVPLLAGGKIKGIFGEGDGFLLRARPLPFGKWEVNDLPGSPVRLLLPGGNDAWPDGGGGVAIRDGATSALTAPPFSRVGLMRTRAVLGEEHLTWAIALLHFLQSEPSVPASVREEALSWGLCRDEFTASAHLPVQPYVREARRMLGQYIFTQADAAVKSGESRPVLQRGSIAIGDAPFVCAATALKGPAIGGEYTGAFNRSVAAFQIPFGVIVPTGVENLLVVGAPSASHVGFAALQHEPVRCALGEAAGYASHLARKDRSTVQTLSIAKLQARLHQAGTATVYTPDVGPESPDFIAVQWWGTLGGFHRTGKSVHTGNAQANESVNNIRLAAAIDASCAKEWSRIASEEGFTAPVKSGTRGEWIRKLAQDNRGR